MNHTAVDGARVPNRWGEGRRLRQEILDAAKRMLAETGRPETISLRAIARAAGITPSAIYLHFKDKDELMWALLDTVYARLAENMRQARAKEPAEDPWAGLRAVVDVYRRFATDEPSRYNLLFRIGPALPSVPAAHPMGQVFGVWQESIEPCLDESSRLSSAELAKLLWSGLHGQFGLWWNLSDDTDDRELGELQDSLLRALFGR